MLYMMKAKTENSSVWAGPDGIYRCCHCECVVFDITESWSYYQGTCTKCKSTTHIFGKPSWETIPATYHDLIVRELKKE